MDDTNSQNSPDVAEQEVKHHEKTPQESFAELRRAKDELEKQLWQANKERELIEKQLQSQLQPKSSQSQDDDYDFRQLEKEDFPDGKQILKAFNTVNKKLSVYDQKLAEKDIKIQALEFAVEHPDFKNVVTPENIEKYIKNDEDNREAVERASNPLKKVYSLIKKSGAYQAEIAAKTKSISQEQKRVEEKESKPKTTSIGVRSEAVSTAAQISNSRMSREQRNALWAETMAAARR